MVMWRHTSPLYLNQTLVMNLQQRMRRNVFKDLDGVRKQSLRGADEASKCIYVCIFYTFLLFYHYEENYSSARIVNMIR